jgi:hypothetical protein
MEVYNLIPLKVFLLFTVRYLYKTTDPPNSQYNQKINNKSTSPEVDKPQALSSNRDRI